MNKETEKKFPSDSGEGLIQDGGTVDETGELLHEGEELHMTVLTGDVTGDQMSTKITSKGLVGEG